MFQYAADNGQLEIVAIPQGYVKISGNMTVGALARSIRAIVHRDDPLTVAEFDIRNRQSGRPVRSEKVLDSVDRIIQAAHAAWQASGQAEADTLQADIAHTVKRLDNAKRRLALRRRQVRKLTAELESLTR